MDLLTRNLMMDEVLPPSPDLAADKAIVRQYLDRIHAPEPMDGAETEEYKSKIKKLLLQENAVLVAHYYTNPVIQQLAEETGGCVSDSLEMARFGKQHDARTLVVAGVKFMGQTAKILTPEKRVLMPTLQATCSLDIACPSGPFAEFCDQHADYTVVVYANTSAAVKARSDWVVTSSIALDVVEHLLDRGEKVLWAPDKHLGRYIQGTLAVGVDEDGLDKMLLWNAACIVHEEFKAKGLREMKQLYPQAAVLAHPESPQSVLELADVVGSTSQIIKAACDLDNSHFIVATDEGIFYKMQQMAPGKTFIAAPTAGEGASCRSCANCPWMGMNSLVNLHQSLYDGSNEIIVGPELAKKAMLPLQRMLDFASENRLLVKGKSV